MKNFKHITGAFVGKGGLEIFFQTWTAPKPKGILVLAHGLGEHSGRYMNIIEALDGKNISVYALDHRGHGKSAGKRGHIDAIGDFIYDLKTFVTMVHDEGKNLPLMLMGHSMGGLIACKYALTYPDDMDALVLSSAGLKIAAAIPQWKETLGKFFSKYIPALQMPNGLDANDLSHDQKVIDAYVNDPLVHNLASARFFTEFMGTGAECLDRAAELSMPLLVFHGKEDKIVDYRGSEVVYGKASTPRGAKTLHIFPDLYHETMNEAEPQKSRVIGIVSSWILAHMVKVKPAAKAKPVKAKKAAAPKAKAKKKPAPAKKKSKARK
ncbi:MAG: alpha/beta hydrolase [Spirochaetes bacterium]|nr:MAG: alpha/beta hydrolase [Spirochaetota bacterium]